MPLPPPPAVALTITGYFAFAANSLAASMSSTRSVPGVTGTPLAVMVFLAVALSPIFLIASAEGPINLIPWSVQISTKSARSDINP